MMMMDPATAARLLTSHGWRLEYGNKVATAVSPVDTSDGTFPAPCVDAIAALTAARGALLLSGLTNLEPATFGLLVQLVAREPLLSYTERSSPRTQILPCVYTSTEDAPRAEIFLHSAHT